MNFQFLNSLIVGCIFTKTVSVYKYFFNGLSKQEISEEITFDVCKTIAASVPIKAVLVSVSV